MRTRVIPVLLLRNGGLVKTVKFKNPRYIGDPINSVRIFNEKEVDELAFIDISATPSGKEPDFDMIEQIAGEAFMPMAYGGGVSTFDHVVKILTLGFEKVIFNNAVFENPDLIRQTSKVYGAQSTVVCIDVKKKAFGGYDLYTHSAGQKRKTSLKEHIAYAEELGAGEIIINSIDRDGQMGGYDVDLIKSVTEACSVPVIALGGAGELDHLKSAVDQGGASAVAAGSLFVYQGVHRAVLINYPQRSQISAMLP